MRLSSTQRPPARPHPLTNPALDAGSRPAMAGQTHEPPVQHLAAPFFAFRSSRALAGRNARLGFEDILFGTVELYHVLTGPPLALLCKRQEIRSACENRRFPARWTACKLVLKEDRLRQHNESVPHIAETYNICRDTISRPSR
jgi:hypothetical protein